jgi:glycine cleavage system H lipoate-binding protein
MESGFVDYKICDRDFDCENCPFDQAIHDQSKTSRYVRSDKIDDVKDPNLKFDMRLEIPADVLLSKNHVWIKKIDKEIFYLGVDHLTQCVIKRISTFQFPFVGSQVTKGNPIMWVIGKWGVVSIPSPIHCIIKEVNSEVLLNINNFFFEDIYKVWLLKINSADEKNLAKLNQSENHKKILDEDLTIIKNFTEKIIESSLVGVTMYDGGELLLNLPERLSSQEYVQLLKLIFNKK